jgi:hypothetical protein
VSELNDISGASSSNPVNVLTHTMSEVSHRLTTASEALDARYLYIKDDGFKGQAVSVGCTLHPAARHQQEANACHMQLSQRPGERASAKQGTAAQHSTTNF